MLRCFVFQTQHGFLHYCVTIFVCENWHTIRQLYVPYVSELTALIITIHIYYCSFDSIWLYQELTFDGQCLHLGTGENLLNGGQNTQVISLCYLAS